MTDYEMLSMTVEFVNTTWTIFATYVSIVFAFLVAGYLVADKLDAKIVVVITLYTLVAFWAVWGLNRTSAGLQASIAEIKRAFIQLTVRGMGSSDLERPLMAAESGRSDPAKSPDASGRKGSKAVIRNFAV